MTYIAREPQCGCVTAALADQYISLDQAARQVAEFILDGRTVNHVEEGAVTGCPHWSFTAEIKRRRIRTDVPFEETA